MVFVARRVGAWATDGGRAFLRWASGLEFAVDEACNGVFRGRRFLRWVTDCRSWADGDIGAGGGVAVGVLGVRSGGEKEMTIDSLRGASVQWSDVECFLPVGAAVAL
jgi:hypothetical protein